MRRYCIEPATQTLLARINVVEPSTTADASSKLAVEPFSRQFADHRLVRHARLPLGGFAVDFGSALHASHVPQDG